jgi:hypothetical protein
MWPCHIGVTGKGKAVVCNTRWQARQGQAKAVMLVGGRSLILKPFAHVLATVATHARLGGSGPVSVVSSDGPMTSLLAQTAQWPAVCGSKVAALHTDVASQCRAADPARPSETASGNLRRSGASQTGHPRSEETDVSQRVVAPFPDDGEPWCGSGATAAGHRAL